MTGTDDRICYGDMGMWDWMGGWMDGWMDG